MVVGRNAQPIQIIDIYIYPRLRLAIDVLNMNIGDSDERERVNIRKY